MSGVGQPLRRWLASAPAWAFSTFAVTAAFTAYFCMYSYRKPYAAALYEGSTLGALDLKSALIISQLIGYALSKFIGIKFNSEMPHHRRALALVALIVWAELALVLFAIAPPYGKAIAIFLNGLALGAVWGLVFSFLEGRRTSEILGAGLSCSYIVASGAVKSAGTWVLESGIDESWMPAATGAMFLPIFLLAVYALSLLPAPNAQDVAARTARAPMDRAARRAFFWRYMPGLLLLIVVYVFLTAYRDFRDNYAAELWRDLGYAGEPSVFTLSELPIALLVLIALGLLYLVRDNRLGFLGTYGIMMAGSALIGVATVLFDLGAIGGMPWMILVGLGLYLGYVPYGCVLFDRMIAALGVVATSVFLIYLTDAVGYGGSVALVVYKRLGQTDMSMLDFFRVCSYVTCAVTLVCFSISARYFRNRTRAPEASAAPEPPAS